MKHSQQALAMAVLAVLPLGKVHAESADDLQGVQLNWDNDVWTRSRTDRWYTNGIRYTWTYKSGAQNAATRNLVDAAGWMGGLTKTPTLSYSIGQTMYTPRNITDPAPQPFDRPWAAFLFAGVTGHAFEGNRFAATDIKLGVLGPAALGRQVQTLVHRLTDSDLPQGWAQQQRPRMGAQISHARVYRYGQGEKGDLLGFQLGWGAALGTLRNYASVNATMTVGRLEGNQAPILIGNEGDFVAQDFGNHSQFEQLYAFVGVSATAVAYNHFLSGRTPYGRPQIDRRNGYSMLHWGVSLPTQRWWRHWAGSKAPRVVYSQTVRSPEFDSPAVGGDEGPQRWGTLSLQWDFE